MSEQATETGSVRVVGTAHVSADSVEEVERTIEAERPDVVAVELDQARYDQMRGDGPEDFEPSDLLSGNTVFQFLAYWMLSYVQTRLGEQFDVKPGADMLAAIESAEEHSLDVALVDRDINVTIQRFWARLSTREKLGLVGGLLLSVAPPVYLGAMLGATFGLTLGIVLGTAAAGPLGLTTANLTALLGTTVVTVVGGLIAGLVAGVLLWSLAGDVLASLLRTVGVDDGTGPRLAAGVGLGLLGGLVVVATGGLSVGPLSLTTATLASLGAGAFGLVAGIVIGVAVLGGAGAALGALYGRFAGYDADSYEELDMAELTDADVVSVMMEEFRRFSPGGAEALIDERDAFIAHNLIGLRAAGKDVVAVVGAGHRAGIEGYLERPETLPPKSSLVGVQKGRRFSPYKIVGYAFTLGFALFFLLIAMAGVRNSFLLQLFGAWFLVNAVFTVGLAKLAGAHWSSASVGGLVAWLTSVNPLLAPGWFTGYVELRHTTVNVSDISTLNELLSDEERPLGDLFAEMRRVPLFKLILIVAMTNIGSFVGSILFATVLIPALFSQVGGLSEVSRLMVEGARNSIDLILGVL